LLYILIINIFSLQFFVARGIPAIILILFWFLSWPLIAISFLFSNGYFYSLSYYAYEEQQSFWERNKDQIIVALIIAIISTILGAIGTLVLSDKI